MSGLGLLPVETTFSAEKRVTGATYELAGAGLLQGASGSVSGYEIHAGETTVPDEVSRPIGPQSAAIGRVFGTYLHGCFENEVLRDAFLETVFADADVDPPEQTADRRDPIDRAARLVEPVDLDTVLSAVAVTADQ